jgi:trk system potassium uptake protein TrkH
MVLTVFEVLAAINFATHYLAWSERGLTAYFRDAEAKAILSVLVVSCVGIAVFLFVKGAYEDFPTALRHATFNVVSIATDSGLHTQDYSRWPIFAPMWMIFLSCIVASSGSTGGGIKMIRTLVLAKQAHRELNQLVHPNMVRPLKVGGNVIANRVVFAVLAFVFLYFMSVVTLVFVQLGSGLDFMTSLSSILACINNAGPGLGRVGAGQQLRSLDRLPDLGVFGRDAARPARGFYHFGAVHSHFMEKIGNSEVLRSILWHRQPHQSARGSTGPIF